MMNINDSGVEMVRIYSQFDWLSITISPIAMRFRR
jgi:hypothetical protein